MTKYVGVLFVTLEWTEVRCGIPQGPILGPLLVNNFMLPLVQVITRNTVSYHSYADDAELYITMSPGNSKTIQSLNRKNRSTNGCAKTF